MSILHSSARPSGASRRSREALLAARRGPVVHRATNYIPNTYRDGCYSSKFLDRSSASERRFLDLEMFVIRRMTYWAALEASQKTLLAEG